ncbi:MAG: class II aldolase/adducin family protein [Gemmatimonadaceae bacterium]|nr:class II aldolase/adducin family protein [Gemmatimonadaceae bacterium]
MTACQRLYARGLISGPDGNVSVRLAGDRILVTPSGLSKVDVHTSDLVEMRLDGRVLDGRAKPSSEVQMHLRIYQRRPDVHAVVHAHPPTATAFSVAGETLASDVLPELIHQVGHVPLIPFAMPGTTSLADAFEPFLAAHDAFLMANHGATTVGSTLSMALQRMESLEHGATILLTARMLGRVNSLAPSQVQALLDARARAARGPAAR